MSNTMDAVLLAALFLVIAAAIYLCLSLILRKLDDRHERQSSKFGRKNPG
jgi:ABC-type arginine/histidine transport system permease subunit